MMGCLCSGHFYLLCNEGGLPICMNLSSTLMYSLSELFYDAKGILREPGELYYDGRGVLRRPGEPFYDYFDNYVYPNELDLFRDKRRNWVRCGELFRDGRDTLRRYDPDRGPMVYDPDL